MKWQVKDRKSGQNVLITPQESCALTNDFFWWCYCLCVILLFPTTSRWEYLASLCCLPGARQVHTMLLLYHAVSGIFAGPHWNVGLYSSQPVTWSLPFVNIIWDVQTSQISLALCKAYWVHCFSAVVFTDVSCCNLTINRHVCRSDSVHAPPEAAFLCLSFHSSNVV